MIIKKKENQTMSVNITAKVHNINVILSENIFIAFVLCLLFDFTLYLVY